MPGIIGIVGHCANDVAIISAENSICHFDDYYSSRTSPFDGVQIAQVWRNPKESAGAWHEDKDSGTSVFVNGTIVMPGPEPRQIDAKDVLQAYLTDDLRPNKYDGSFVYVIADSRKGELILCNDRLGTLPCYFYTGAGCFCFGPEAKAIFSALDLVPEYSATGLTTFLALGYCLSNSTLYKSIHFLEPASRIVVNVSTCTYRITRYWKLRFDPARNLRSRRKAEELLYESILAGHRSAFSNAAEQYHLLLSGGWDSRGMLAAANKLGHKPQRSISWGLRNDVPGSDPFLAAQLAEQYDLEHRFISYDTDSFIENALQWTYLTELNTDNFGWYGEGTNILLNEYADKADYMLAGDECWGFGDHVRTREEAMAACHMPAPFQTSLTKYLNGNLATECPDIYSSEIDKVLSCCENDNPNDQKDFLYLHGRVARFIFSLGYYKELAVEIRRPFLTSDVLDIIQQLPTRYRYGKNLYISTLIRFFPELLKVHKRSTNSLPQWRRDLREKPELSRYFSNLLSNETLSQTGFAEHLDLKEIEKISEKFFSTPFRTQKSIDRSARHGALVQSLKQHLTAYDDIRLALHLKGPITRQLNDFDLLRRLALLSLLDQNLSRLPRSTLRS